MMESLATINSFFRTLLAAVVLGAASYAGWLGYNTYNSKEIEALPVLSNSSTRTDMPAA